MRVAQRTSAEDAEGSLAQVSTVRIWFMTATGACGTAARAAEPGAAGFAVWVEGTGTALLGGAAPAARAWRRACVHRSAQARVSWQYHRMSSHALSPSGIIWS